LLSLIDSKFLRHDHGGIVFGSNLNFFAKHERDISNKNEVNGAYKNSKSRETNGCKVE
jgi:hypothetical protein